MTISPIFDAERWQAVPGAEFSDITYHRARDQGTVKQRVDTLMDLPGGLSAFGSGDFVEPFRCSDAKASLTGDLDFLLHR